MENTITKAQDRENGYYWVRIQSDWVIAEFVKSKIPNEPDYWNVPGHMLTRLTCEFQDIDETPINRITYSSAPLQTEILNECLESLEKARRPILSAQSHLNDRTKLYWELQSTLASFQSCISKLKNLLGQPETKNDTE